MSDAVLITIIICGTLVALAIIGQKRKKWLAESDLAILKERVVALCDYNNPKGSTFTNATSTQRRYSNDYKEAIGDVIKEIERFEK